ncbi:hypothetical protein J4475_04510 [Candidatus Woesearchaeota archaeon]|nr:hypothetical protein [Candidatus Woesearchaeota archaeon]
MPVDLSPETIKSLYFKKIRDMSMDSYYQNQVNFRYAKAQARMLRDNTHLFEI